jgi:5-methyltetrahydrofolate--homocysteine methyltransferase
MASLVEALQSGRVLLMDGAMGTELQRAGISSGECYERWNLTQPAKVRAIHQAYGNAGAEVLLTNTFQANPEALARHGLQDQLGPLLQAGVDLARAAVGPERFVLVDIGPTKSLPKSTWAILKGLRGADALLLETWSDLEEARKLIQVGRNLSGCSLPVLLSCTFWRRPPSNELRTLNDFTPEACARIAGRNGFTALGVNCGRDLHLADIVEILQRYRTVTALPLFARPNAGTPTRLGDHWVYSTTPEQMAAGVPDLITAGAVMVGGCCGTTPEHIGAFRRILDARTSR